MRFKLTVNQACTDTLLDGAIDDAEHNRTFLRRIESQRDRLSRLIKDLLQLGRIESADSGIDVTDIDLGKLIRGCLADHKSVADSRGIVLAREISRPSPIIQGDNESLLTILGNLIENAIRYWKAIESPLNGIYGNGHHNPCSRRWSRHTGRTR